MFVDFLDESCNGFGFWIQFVKATEVSDEFDELIVDLPLIFWFFFLLADFSVKNLDELRLK